ncbi:uncharacterized protein CBL_05494 [Carabus blaptoides fortunei]
MEIRYKGNARIFLIAFFGILLVCASYLIYFLDPLQKIISKMMLLSDGSVSYEIWKKPPYTIYITVYVFNVTNADAFISGEEKLQFEEIGPYVFQEMLENTEAVFNDNGTLSFVPRRELKFIREMSVGDPKEQYVNVPNVPLLGIASMLHQSSMFLNLAVLSITRMLNSQPVLTMTVEDYFWGYEDKLVHMASKVLPNWIFFEKFGVLDRMFDEGNNTVTINVDPTRKTGSALISEQERGRLYSILTYNGSPGLSQWGYQLPVGNETVESNTKCNMLEGAYDGTLYPPGFTPDEVFRLYRKPFCRTVPIEYYESGLSEDNFNAYFYKMTDNFLDREEDNPDNDCYCKDKNYCLPAGFGDTTPCYYGFPTAVSLPHYLHVDESVYKRIGGMAPNEEDHGTKIVINPEMGLVLKGHSRIQINLIMRQTKYNYKTAPFNNMIIPLFWTEMRVDELPSQIHMLMTLSQKVMPVVQIVFIYLFAIIGAALIATAGILVFLTIGAPVINRSPSLNGGYTPLRIIPVIRRESLLTDIRRHNK